MVEEVSKSSAAERAGIQPGDLVVGWSRAANPPADPSAAAGRVDSPFDLMDVETEQAPRGPVTLVGVREGKAFTARIPVGIWEIRSRPRLQGRVLSLYEDARRLLHDGDGESAAGLWRQAAREAAKDRLGASWLLCEVGRAWAGVRRWEEAEKAYQAALEATPQPLVRAWVHTSRAGLFKAKEEKAKSEEAFREALKIRRWVSDGSLAVAASLEDLGAHLWGSGLQVAATVHSLGRAAQVRGDVEAATGLLSRALSIRERLAPGTWPEAESLHALGALHREAGRLEAAVGFFRRAIDALEAQTGRLGGADEQRSAFSAS